jgi:hypothetical protein
MAAAVLLCVSGSPRLRLSLPVCLL